MKTGPIGTLPGFQTFNAFFADLKGDFEPTRLTDKENAVAWEVRVYDETPVRVDEMLWRSLELAKLQNDEIRVRTVQAVGVDDEWVDNRFRFLDIASGTWEEMQERIYEKACGLGDKAKAAKLFALLALRGHVTSCKNLAQHFHSGRGVEADPYLAEYWNARAANVGA